MLAVLSCHRHAICNIIKAVFFCWVFEMALMNWTFGLLSFLQITDEHGLFFQLRMFSKWEKHRQKTQTSKINWLKSKMCEWCCKLCVIPCGLCSKGTKCDMNFFGFFRKITKKTRFHCLLCISIPVSNEFIFCYSSPIFRQCWTKKRSDSTRWPKKIRLVTIQKCKIMCHQKELFWVAAKSESRSKIQMLQNDRCKYLCTGLATMIDRFDSHHHGAFESICLIRWN